MEGFNDAQVTKMITVVEAALKEMTTAATTLGAAKTRVDGQKTFTTSLMDSIDRGVGQLVDADMNKESTRLQALQVQQQLGIQALSIANGNSQSILSLFRVNGRASLPRPVQRSALDTKGSPHRAILIRRNAATGA